LQAVLLDPGFRPDSYDRAMKDAELMYQQMERNIRGKLTTRIEPFLGGKRSGFGLPEWTVFQELTLEDAKGWLEPYFRDAPLEISIVGDIDHQQLIHLVSSYFGFISERHYRLDGQKELVFPAGESLEVEVDTSFDKSVVRMAWLTDDFWDIGRSRRLHVLAAVLEDRLRQVIRESLGASYSPSAYSTTSRIYPGFGLLQIQTIVENASLDSIRQKVAEVAASMVENKVDSEELERAKGPMITSLKEAVRTNRYWLSSVLSLSSRYPQQLHWPLEMIDDYSSVSA
jgi:zinc protease